MLDTCQAVATPCTGCCSDISVVKMSQQDTPLLPLPPVREQNKNSACIDLNQLLESQVPSTNIKGGGR